MGFAVWSHFPKCNSGAPLLKLAGPHLVTISEIGVWLQALTVVFKALTPATNVVPGAVNHPVPG